MNYRKFVLTNSNGLTWALTDAQVKSFLSDPSGLGFNNSLETMRYGEKTVLTAQTYELPVVSGTVDFFNRSNETRYQNYNDFCRFVMETPLTLSYIVPFTTPVTYTLDGYVTRISKTQSSPEGILSCEFEFQGMSFWEGTEVTVTGTGDSYTITNNGDFPIGFEITIEGSLENPYFTLSQNSDVYGEAKFDDDTAFDSVYIDSKDGEQNVVLEQSGAVVANPLGYQDLSISNGSIYVTFVKLARGTSTLAIGYDSGSITSVEIKHTPQYRSV